MTVGSETFRFLSPIGCWKRDVLLPSPIGCCKPDVSLLSPIGCWKRDVSLPSPIGCWKRDVSLPSPIGCWKRNVSLLSPKQQYIYCGCGSETFRFLPPLVVGSETFCFLPPLVVGSETFRFLPPLVVGSETFRFLPPLVVGSETFRFFPPLVVGSETFRFFHPNNNTYIVGVEASRFASFLHWLLEARRFASFPHWLLEARRFASFLHWLLEAKRFASFTQTTIHILWAWKRDVSLPSSIGCWKRDVSLPSPIGCWKRDVSLLSPKQQYIYCGRGSETFRFLSPLATEAERFASARTIMERTTRFQKHIMFEGILSHIMPSANCPFDDQTKSNLIVRLDSDFVRLSSMKNLFNFVRCDTPRPSSLTTLVTTCRIWAHPWCKNQTTSKQ